MTAVTYFVYDRDNIHKRKLASAEKALDWNGTPYLQEPDQIQVFAPLKS